MSEIKTNKLDDKIEVTFSLNGEEWTNLLSKAKKEIFEKLELKGFRPGKVPENIAEKNVSQEQIRSEALNKAINLHFESINNEIFKEEVISKPKLEVMKITNDEIEVKFTSSLMPKVQLGDISKIDIVYEVAKVAQEEIDNELEAVDKMLTERVDIEPGTDIVDGNIVNLDFLGKVDGKEFTGGKSEGFDLTIGSKSFIDTFEDQIIGHKIGDEFIVKVIFPETYPEESLKGKEAEFEVKINSVKNEIKLKGESLDEQLQQMGFKSFADLKEKVAKMAVEKKEQEARDAYFDKFIDAVTKLEGSKISIPDDLKNQEIQKAVQNFEHQLSHQGMKLVDYLKMLKISKEEFIEKNVTPQATKKIISELIYSQLIKDLAISVTDEEVQNELEKIAKENNLSIDEVKKQLPEHNVKSGLTFNKLIAKIKK